MSTFSHFESQSLFGRMLLAPGTHCQRSRKKRPIFVMHSLGLMQAGATLKKGEKPVDMEDDRLWGRQPSRVLAVGLSEDLREHNGRLRKYLRYYLDLLFRAGDVETLSSAVGYLRRASSNQPGLGDLLR